VWGIYLSIYLSNLQKKKAGNRVAFGTTSRVTKRQERHFLSLATLLGYHLFHLCIVQWFLKIFIDKVVQLGEIFLTVSVSLYLF
jgi:hypothetical protein